MNTDYRKERSSISGTITGTCEHSLRCNFTKHKWNEMTVEMDAVPLVGVRSSGIVRAKSPGKNDANNPKIDLHPQQHWRRVIPWPEIIFKRAMILRRVFALTLNTGTRTETTALFAERPNRKRIWARPDFSRRPHWAEDNNGVSFDLVNGSLELYSIEFPTGLYWRRVKGDRKRNCWLLPRKKSKIYTNCCSLSGLTAGSRPAWDSTKLSTVLRYGW